MTDFPKLKSREKDVLQHMNLNFNSIANLIPSKEVLQLVDRMSYSSSSKMNFLVK